MPTERAARDAVARLFHFTERGAMRRVLLAAAVVFIANLFYLGAKPFAVGLFPSPWDKLAHLLAFGFLAGLLWLGWLRQRSAWVVLVVSLIGAADEWHQRFLPGRSADPYDLLTDIFAAILAVAALGVVRRWAAWSSREE